MSLPNVLLAGFAVGLAVVAGAEVKTTAAGVEYEARNKRNLQLRHLRPFFRYRLDDEAGAARK